MQLQINYKFKIFDFFGIVRRTLCAEHSHFRYEILKFILLDILVSTQRVAHPKGDITSNGNEYSPNFNEF